MPHRSAPLDIDPRWTPSQVRLWEAHRDRLADRAAARARLGRWFDSAPPPDGEAAFLHLLYLAGTSEALFLALLRHPGHLHQVSREVGAPRGLGPDGMDEALARFLLLGRWPSQAAALAAFRALQTARVLLQDVLDILPFDAVTGELSALADVLISRSFVFTYQPIRESLGLPMSVTSDGRPAPCKMAVFALGKLGGSELNYSSDVDLVAFYGSEGSTDQGSPNSVFFSDWVRAAVGLLTEPTPDGPCLRVDMNLRPRGRDGELTLPMDAALAYYQEWADLWERQAWIKARPCAGDRELGARFIKQMEDIVYQPYSWTGIATQVRRMRAMAISKLGKGAVDDVKEGPGGIRDAEFAVQALQLAHGPSDRWVRERQTLLAGTKLVQKGVLSTASQGTLDQCYTLLRRTEHWIQVQNMRQTHRLPPEGPAWAPLSRFLGFAGTQEGQRAVAQARANLGALFYRTLGEIEGRDAEVDTLSSILTPEGMLALLQQGRFKDPRRALPLLAGIFAVLTPHMGQSLRGDNLTRVVFSLRGEFGRVHDPYQGLATLHRLVQALSDESGAVFALLDSPRLPRLLFRLANQSEALTDTLVRMPALVPLLSFGTMRDLANRLESPPDTQEGPDALRRWQKEIALLAGAREIVSGESVAWSQGIHSRLAETVCSSVFGSACAVVEAREGLGPGALSGSIGLVALGRLGFREMHPRSDLDLVFVKRGEWVLPSDPDRSARAEGAVVREMVAALAAMTRHGSLYDTDLRLRPYGASGPAVQSLDALRAYFSGTAQLWERFAYLKGRPVTGDLHAAGDALEIVWNLSIPRGIGREELAGLLELRRRLDACSPGFEGDLKFSQGGLLHQDLLVFSLQARVGLAPGEGGFFCLLDRLESAGILDDTQKGDLYRARRFMEGFLHRSRLRFARSPGRVWGPGILRDLDALWKPRPSGLDGDVDPSRLAKVWNEYRTAVVRLWDELVEV